LLCTNNTDDEDDDDSDGEELSDAENDREGNTEFPVSNKKSEGTDDSSKGIVNFG
jgi:hypothetical protein